MHPYDKFISERILKQNDVREARQWLNEAGERYGVIHELSHEESLEIVEEAYRRGAVRVEVVGMLSGKVSESNVDMALIILPTQKTYREMLFELEEIIAMATGFEGSVDEGQESILLRWT